MLGARLASRVTTTSSSSCCVAASAAWLVLGYVVPWTAVLGREERPTAATANGIWFTSQSMAVAAAIIEPIFATGRCELVLLAVMSWSVGFFLSAAGMIVALRLMLYEFGPEEVTPPYWVSMGELAITVLADARIVEMADAPMVAAGWWRHVVKRLPLRYEATLWAAFAAWRVAFLAMLRHLWRTVFASGR